MKFILALFICFFVFIQSINADTYISEINFIDNEYVEIYSNESLNLSEFILYDEGGIIKSNILTEIKLVNNSKYFLIASDNFISNIDILNLNCSIYTNSKSEIGYYGLKNGGENITLYSNTSNQSFNYIKEEDFSFNFNESLNYDFNSSFYFILNQTPCLSSFLINSDNSDNLENINNSTNLTILSNLSNLNIVTNLTLFNSSNLNETNQITSNESIIFLDQNNCNYYFEIITSQEIFTNKLKYKFKTNATNFFIEYWLEDFGGNIIKNKLNSTSLSEKSFTPDFSEILVIKANLYLNNNTCILNSSKIAYFYSQKKDLLDINSNKTISSQKIIDTSPYIRIINYDKIKNLSTDVLEYEVYRGNSSKRTVYIYHNKEKLSSFELEKYSKVSGKISFEKVFGNNSLIIFGFDLESRVDFYPPEIKSSVNLSNLSNLSEFKEFEIIDFNLNNENKVTFNINFDINYDAICQIYYDKTLVSTVLELLNISNDINQNFNESKVLDLNISKIDEKWQKTSINEKNEKNNTIELKLSCKYKKSELKTYKYYSYLFNYSLENEFKGENKIIENNDNSNNEFQLIEIKNKTYEYSNYSFDETKVDFDTFSYFEKEELKLNQIKTIQNPKENEKIKTETVYTSTNYLMKENSYFGVFIASTIILISLIAIW